MDTNNESENPEKMTHEVNCPVGGKDKWSIAGQAMFNSANGKDHFFVTSLYCQECGFVKIVLTPVRLPEIPNIAVAQPIIMRKN